MREDESDAVLRDLQACEDTLQKLRKSTVKLIESKNKFKSRNSKMAAHLRAFHSTGTALENGSRLTFPSRFSILGDIKKGKSQLGDTYDEVPCPDITVEKSDEAAEESRQLNVPLLSVALSKASSYEVISPFISKSADFWDGRENATDTSARRATASVIGSGRLPLADQFRRDFASFETALSQQYPEDSVPKTPPPSISGSNADSPEPSLLDAYIIDDVSSARPNVQTKKQNDPFL